MLDKIFPSNFRDFRTIVQDPLYQNSFYLILTMVLGAVLGFIFWIVAAQLYTQEEVGINTALISAVSLLAIISYLGLDQSIIRFFPDKNKFNIMTTSSVVILISTILFGIIFVLGIDLWAPDLALVKNNLLAFFMALIAFTLSGITGNAFIALRKSKYYFYQNLLMNLRVLLIFIPFFGSLGIFLSFGISVLIAIIFSYILIFKIIKPETTEKVQIIDWDFLWDSFHFSAGNYFFMLFGSIPVFILPIIVLNVLGSGQTAYYYITYTIASFLFMLSSAFSTSLFVEGSHGESLRENTKKSLIAIFSLLIPLAGLIFIFGKYILGLFGSDYVNGLDLLRVMIISSFLYSICQVYYSIGKVRNKIKDLILVSLVISILLIGSSYFLMDIFGIVGIGYAWVISYLAGSILVILKIKNLK